MPEIALRLTTVLAAPVSAQQVEQAYRMRASISVKDALVAALGWVGFIGRISTNTQNFTTPCQRSVAPELRSSATMDEVPIS